MTASLFGFVFTFPFEEEVAFTNSLVSSVDTVLSLLKKYRKVLQP